MDTKLSERLLAKARENGEKNGKLAELDFVAGGEWMYSELANKLPIHIVSKLLIAFQEFAKTESKGFFTIPDALIDGFIESNYFKNILKL